MTPAVMQRAVSLGLVQHAEYGKVRVAHRRFLETGTALAHLGIPADVILDALRHCRFVGTAWSG